MKVGFTCGAFDLVHSGHIIMFEEAKEHCDYLIVGLQTDPTISRNWKQKPIQTVYERYVQLKAVKYIDEIIPYDTEESLMDLLLATKIDIRFVGAEYENQKFTGKEIVSNIHYTRRQHPFSSTRLRNKINESGTK